MLCNLVFVSGYVTLYNYVEVLQLQYQRQYIIHYFSLSF